MSRYDWLYFIPVGFWGAVAWIVGGTRLGLLAIILTSLGMIWIISAARAAKGTKE